MSEDITNKLHEYIRELESAIDDLPCGPEVLSERGYELYEWYNMIGEHDPSRIVTS